MKKEYQSPQIKVVGFRVENGFAPSGEQDLTSISSSTVQDYGESEHGYVFGEGIN